MIVLAVVVLALAVVVEFGAERWRAYREGGERTIRALIADTE